MLLTLPLRDTSTSRSTRRGRRRYFHPRIERLEDRFVPAAILVDTLLDASNPNDGVTSLREAIAAANNQAGDDVITFDVTGTINLTGALPNLSTDIEIRGPGAASLTVRRDTGGDYSVLNVTTGTTISLSGLTIANGRAINGGAINNDGLLWIARCSLTNNTAFQRGGGINNDYILTVSDSTFSGNTTTGNGGAIYTGLDTKVFNCTFANNLAANGGGIYNYNHSWATGSTFFGNAATQAGGGIHNALDFGGAAAGLVNCTLTGNSATTGGGIFNQQILVLYNSIVANSPSGMDVVNNADVFADYNLIETTNNWLGLVRSIAVDPLLGPLQDNGGPTWTCALSPSSPAIDAGDNSLIGGDSLDVDADGNASEPAPFDQRGPGYPRAVGRVDLGAVEDSVLAFRSPAGIGINRLALRRAGDDVQLLRNGTVVSTRPLDHTYSVDLRGTDNQVDVLTIDFAAGAFAVPGGIKFAGGTGAPRDMVAARGDADMILTDDELTVLGSGVNLALAFTGVEAAQLTGGVGDNLLDASGFNGPTTLSAGSGDDQLIGGSGIDRLFGSSGDDRLTSMAGNDLVDGGSGFDTLAEVGDVDFTLFAARLTGLGSDTFRSIESAELTGGDGDNVINAGRFAGPVILDGGAGNDVLVGGASDDILNGSLGRDILIGGRGADGLDGGDGDDVLIGGTTGHDANRIALDALRFEWTSTSDYATRIGHLRGTTAGGVNGIYRLTPLSVKHDLAANLLSGSLDLDWFFAKSMVDSVMDRNSGGAEIVTALV